MTASRSSAGAFELVADNSQMVEEVVVDAEVERPGSWRERAHDRALTALLGVKCFIWLGGAPAAATGHWSGRVALQLAVLGLAVVVFVISHGLVPTIVAVFTIACGLA